jgi:hypothetical protein
MRIEVTTTETNSLYGTKIKHNIHTYSTLDGVVVF